MSGDLISREELEKALSMVGRMYIDGIADDKAYLQEQRVYEVLRNAPTVEAEPVVHARWTFKNLSQIAPNCSNCKMQSIMRYPRCPYCGAHMDEEVADA